MQKGNGPSIGYLSDLWKILRQESPIVCILKKWKWFPSPLVCKSINHTEELIIKKDDYTDPHQRYYVNTDKINKNLNMIQNKQGVIGFNLLLGYTPVNVPNRGWHDPNRLLGPDRVRFSGPSLRRPKDRNHQRGSLRVTGSSVPWVYPPYRDRRHRYERFSFSRRP